MRRSKRFRVGRWRQRPDLVATIEREAPPGMDVLGVYELGPCRLILSRDDGDWHASISHPTRYPTWDEIAEARYQLCPDDVTMAIILPPSDEYVNLHPNCFHLHQIPDDVAEYRPAKVIQ